MEIVKDTISTEFSATNPTSADTDKFSIKPLNDSFNLQGYRTFKQTISSCELIPSALRNHKHRKNKQNRNKMGQKITNEQYRRVN